MFLLLFAVTFSVNGIWLLNTDVGGNLIVGRLERFLSTTLLPYSCLKYPEKKKIQLAFKEQIHAMVNYFCF